MVGKENPITIVNFNIRVDQLFNLIHIFCGIYRDSVRGMEDWMSGSNLMLIEGVADFENGTHIIQQQKSGYVHSLMANTHPKLTAW